MYYPQTKKQNFTKIFDYSGNKMITSKPFLFTCLISLLIFFQLGNCNPTPSNTNTQAIASLVLASGSSNFSTSTSVVVLPEDIADTVTSAPNHTGSGFQDKTKAINGVRGLGTNAGSGDVFSLTKTGSGASIVLEWNGKRIVNGTGIDFIVFENVFYYNGNSSARFMEATIVEVSQDNINYCGFSPDFTATLETSYSNNPIHWSNFAGITPTLYNVSSNPLSGDDLYDLSKTGGDGFDLENLSSANDFNIGCNSVLRDNIVSEGFVYLRLTSATARINPDTSSNFLQDTGAFGGGPDIDGVIARYRSVR